MKKRVWFIWGTLLTISAFVPAPRAQETEKIAIVPWIFKGGTDTAQRTAKETLEKLFSSAGLEMIPEGRVTSAWQNQTNFQQSSEVPAPAELVKLGQTLKVDYVLAGKAEWHSRSIWVGLGPKTKSTCTVDAVLVDVRNQTLALNSRGVKMDSNAKEDTLKALGAVFVTSLFTVVSGGPKTPHEQRAGQFAIAKALEPWLAPRLSRVGSQINISGGSTPAGGGAELEAFPLEVANNLTERIAQQVKQKQEKRTLVVLPFRISGVSDEAEEKYAQQLGMPLQDDLISALVSAGVRTVEPAQLEKALSEINLAQPGLSEEKLTSELAKKLPNSLFLVGSISRRGSETWVVNARVLDPKTGEALAAAVYQHQVKK